MELFYKVLTDVFDTGAQLYQLRQRLVAGTKDNSFPELPPCSLVTREEKSDPEVFFARSDKAADITFTGRTRLPLIDIHDGFFTSPMTTPFAENNTVRVKHFRTWRNGIGGPTVVMIHGWKMDDYSYFDWWCWRFAAWGLNSILLDMPYHIKRTPKGFFSGQLLLTKDTSWNLATLKQSFEDIQVVVNWLREQGAGPIGTFGVSYGGFMSGLYVCRADNADFAIMGMPPMDTIDVLSTTELGDEWRKMEAEGKTSMLSDPDIPPIYNLSATRPRIPNERVFIAMGKLDKLVNPDSVRKTAADWGGLPWLKEYPTGHINTFALNFAFIEDVRRFLNKEIL